MHKRLHLSYNDVRKATVAKELRRYRRAGTLPASVEDAMTVKRLGTEE